MHQFAVDKKHRRKKAATSLFAYIAVNFGAEISMINIDSEAVGTIAFLEKIGLAPYVTQHEMALVIDATFVSES